MIEQIKNSVASVLDSIIFEDGSYTDQIIKAVDKTIDQNENVKNKKTYGYMRVNYFSVFSAVELSDKRCVTFNWHVRPWNI